MPDRAFGDRIARNISVLLREESYLDKVADPSAGSYYIETLTHQLVEAAWALFLDVEKRGGFKKALPMDLCDRKLIDPIRQKSKPCEMERYWWA